MSVDDEFSFEDLPDISSLAMNSDDEDPLADNLHVADSFAIQGDFLKRLQSDFIQQK